MAAETLEEIHENKHKRSNGNCCWNGGLMDGGLQRVASGSPDHSGKRRDVRQMQNNLGCAEQSIREGSRKLHAGKNDGLSALQIRRTELVADWRTQT